MRPGIIREDTRRNRGTTKGGRRAIGADKNPFHVTERQGDTQTRLVNRLVLAVIGVLILAVLALIFGALGERGFKAVTTAAPTAVAPR